ERLVLGDGEIGEITVRGDLVTAAYHERHVETALAKIADEEGFWHRMGDLGWQDKKGRVWFCGRKSHRVVAAEETLFTIPCEAIFNAHPGVSRSALVGIGPMGAQEPVICIELSPEGRGMPRKALRAELLDLAATHAHTHLIQTVLFHREFPVDIRHNSKIFREKLAVWAAARLGRHGQQQIEGTGAATVGAVPSREDEETTPAETVSTGEGAGTAPEEVAATPKEMATDPEDIVTTKKYRMTTPEDPDESTK
ncbi:MAG: hypothetical protein V2L15_09115, partial [Desulfobacteraceae bacterium]|nr:hypothetical protein [Desulfobacteraceae bacterium]